ncbi:hypothetical protein L3X38_041905 [Prunus dulcis]|uniref:laccase n=1 Tax=Prunus dulcis TaxID=3755 RepID=A0AAD4UV86_PRUDU|nr:hypothetical protein L3X38_041905 [Prunus dulcis]
MLSGKRNSALQILSLLLVFLHCQASSHNYHFVVKEATYTRMCSTKEILAVNGKFPGPVLQLIKVIQSMSMSTTTADTTSLSTGMEQKPVQTEPCPPLEGTIWSHAHSDWSRATVYGAIIVYPKRGASYPFPQPHEEVPIILGQWWKRDIMEVFEEFVRTGGEPNVSDAHTINGQPGDLYPCSKSETFKLFVDENKAYLLRIINAAMNSILFFSIANHNLTLVGADGSYTKPVTGDYIAISPGQTLDALLLTNQQVGQYYMAARAYSSSPAVAFDNTTTTAIVQYNNRNSTPFSSPPILPYLTY